MSKEEIEKQAILLSTTNTTIDTDIREVYWFPHESEVRIIQINPTAPSTGDGSVHPFFFHPSPDDNLPAPSGIAIIQPGEKETVKLPSDWGTWQNAKKLFPDESKPE